MNLLARTAALAALSGLALCATAVPDASAAPGGDLLNVTSDDGHGTVGHHLLRCHPAGEEAATEPGQEDACRRLDELGGPVGPAEKGVMCSMIYGGPQTARITGIWHGRPVDETYSRENGCQTARWQRMIPVLPGPTADRPQTLPAPAPASSSTSTSATSSTAPSVTTTSQGG